MYCIAEMERVEQGGQETSDIVDIIKVNSGVTMSCLILCYYVNIFGTMHVRDCKTNP